MILHRGAPRFLTVRKVPLIRRRDDALVVGPGYDPRLRLEVQMGHSGGDHLVLDQRLGLRDLLTGIRPDRHYPRGETLQVDLVLRLSELRLVVEARDPQLLANEYCRRVTVSLNGDYWDNLVRIDHVGCDPVLGREVRLVLQYLQRHIVVRCIGRDGRHHAGSLAHAYRQQWKDVHFLVRSMRRTQGQAEELVPRERLPLIDLPELPREVHIFGSIVGLTGQAAGGPLAHYEYLVRGIDVIRAVLSVGQHEAIGLAVHGLRPERRGDKVHPPLPLGLDALEQPFHLIVTILAVIGMQHFQLDQDVLLRTDALPLAPIVVGADLTVHYRVDVVPLTEKHLPLLP